jgi:hypothetical protein
MNRTVKGILILASALALAAGASAVAQERSQHVLHDVVTGKIKAPKLTMRAAPNAAPVTRRLPFFSTGPLTAAAGAMKPAAGPNTRAPLATASEEGESPVSGEPETLGCSDRTSKGNVRVNQDCTYRRQAEEKIVYNPANPDNLVAGQNDSRVGFNQCGIDWSLDNGKHWGDLLPPFRQRINDPESELPTPDDPNSHTIVGGPGTGHTYDFASDPAPAFDSQGTAFFTCVALDVFTNANLVFTVQSPRAAHGAFFFNIPQSGRRFIVDEENDPRASLDKPFIAADSFRESPNRDNVYATWTVFNFTCGASGAGFCYAKIFGSMSTDHGLTWSTPEEISGISPTLCFFGNFFDPSQNPNACDFDQGSDPAPLPNGKLVVLFNNGNTPAGDPNSQQLAVVCHPAGSSPTGTARLNCAAPVKVGDDLTVGEPQCDFGRGPEECIPGPFIRTNDFPRIAVSRQSGHVFATWQDYRNGEFDIQLATSTDGGQTWSASATVNPDSGLDHYFPADAAAHSRWDHVGVSYFRSQRVPNENSPPNGVLAPGDPGVQQGNSDYALAGGSPGHTPFRFRVVSPEFPPPDGAQTGFNGDYSGLTINREDEAHPLWSDTRNSNPFPLNGVSHDEDIFTTKVELP